MKRIELRVTDDDYYTIKAMADENGMTVSELIRDRVIRLKPVNLSIDFADIDRFADDISHLVRQVAGIIPIILRSQLVTQSDVDFIKEMIIKIDNKMIEVFHYVTDCRNKMYYDARRKIYKQIRTSDKIRKSEAITVEIIKNEGIKQNNIDETE